MRKIIYSTAFNPKTFNQMLIVRMQEENGSISQLMQEEITVSHNEKYTPQEWAKINQVNSLLEKNGLPPLTDEECNWMLDPYSSTAYLQQEIAEDTLQRLAGFKVEKKITYFDDRSISPAGIHGD